MILAGTPEEDQYKKNVFEAQENFEPKSKDAYESILQYLTIIGHCNSNSQEKKEDVIDKLNSLKGTIDDIIKAVKAPKKSCKDNYISVTE